MLWHGWNNPHPSLCMFLFKLFNLNPISFSRIDHLSISLWHKVVLYILLRRSDLLKRVNTKGQHLFVNTLSRQTLLSFGNFQESFSWFLDSKTIQVIAIEVPVHLFDNIHNTTGTSTMLYSLQKISVLEWNLSHKWNWNSNDDYKMSVFLNLFQRALAY